MIGSSCRALGISYRTEARRSLGGICCATAPTPVRRLARSGVAEMRVGSGPSRACRTPRPSTDPRRGRLRRVGRGRGGGLAVVEEADPALAEPQRLGRQPGVDLGIDGAEHDLADRSADHDVAVAAQQRHAALAERLRQGGAEGGVADQHVGGGAAGVADLEYRHAGAEKRAHVVDRLQPARHHPERDDRRRMAVDDGVDLGARLVDLAVDEAFEIGGAALRRRPPRRRGRTP